MSQVRKIAMFGGTFAVALGIGFVMQNGDALAARFGTEDELRAAQAEVEARSETDHFIVLDALPQDQIEAETPAAETASLETDASASPEAGPVLPDLAQPQTASFVGSIPALDMHPDLPAAPVRMAAADPDLVPGAEAAPVISDAPEMTSADTLDCTPSLTGTPAAGAMVDLVLSAPCSVDSRVTMHHQGVMFTVLTDTAGMAEISVPALAETSIFIADITGSDGAMAMVTVPEVAMYDRAVLQWQGETGLELHAREFGAGYGTEGHIWQGADGAGEGFLVSLGDANAEEALFAEIYTFPTGTAAGSGDVLLSAEIEISSGNCGRDISAQSLQVGPYMESTAFDLTLTLPGCDAAGDFLVLQNMFEDLTLAAR